MHRTKINRIARYLRRGDPDLMEMITPSFEERPPGKVLIVDDEAKVTNAYRMLLAHEGFEVFVASSAVEAREILFREPVSVVVMDINMPEVDGAALFETIRTFHKGIKVLVASVYSVDEQKERVREADGYFDKTDSINELITLVTRLLEKR